jgi:hypothetical protein
MKKITISRAIILLAIILPVITLSSCVFLEDFIQKERTIKAQNRIKFTVDVYAPNVELSSIEAQFNRPFPMMGIAKQDLKAAYYPFEDAVCLQYRLNGYTYYQFWHKDGRDAFVKALETYKEEYSAQKLKNRNNKTKTQYGVIKESYLRWHSFSVTQPATGNMEMEIGYYFKDGSPFFAVTQLEALFENPSLRPEDNASSPEIPIYFTRAQADELAGIFSQDYLVSITPEDYLQAIQNSNRRPEILPPDMDDY